MRRSVLVLAGIVAAALAPALRPPPPAARAQEKGPARELTPAERGKKALLGRSFSAANFTPKAYPNAWRFWDGVKEKPAEYDRAFRERYGLHATPYPNGPYPMGLRQARGLFGKKGLGIDCMLCHGGSVLGQSYVGLGNASLDIQALYEDLDRADGGTGKTPFRACNVRGTTEAWAMFVYLFSFRHPDMRRRLLPALDLGIRRERAAPPVDLGLRDDLCEDMPAWWLLKKRKTMYHTGGADARAVRPLMQFALSLEHSRAAFVKEEATFADVRAYLLSLEPPRYPLPVDRALAGKGEGLFRKSCARCHGTYGPKWTYPNKVVPIEKIGTDPVRHQGLSEKFLAAYDRSWFGQEYKVLPTRGYQAPPLDGIWATAPYFHNGSVPTVYHVLNSKARPKAFTRSYRTDREAYDADKLGWKVTVLEKGPDAKLPAFERRKVYDTTQRGRGNGGHTYGDALTDAERRAIIEYLKTL